MKDDDDDTLTPERLIGRHLYAVRKERGLTQIELGAALAPYYGRPWSRQVVDEAERGRRRFAAIDVIALCAALKITPAWLILPHHAGEVVTLPSGQEFTGLAVDDHHANDARDLASFLKVALAEARGLAEKLKFADHLADIVFATASGQP